MIDNNTQMRTMLQLLEGVAHGTQQLNESIDSSEDAVRVRGGDDDDPFTPSGKMNDWDYDVENPLRKNDDEELDEGLDASEDAVRVRGGQRFVFPEDGKFGYTTDGDNGQITILDQETGEVRDVPLDSLPDSPRQADLEHLVDQYDEEQFRSGAGVPDWIKKSSSMWNEDAAPVKYGVFSTGGSVGSQRFKDEPIKTFDDKEEAKAYARDRRAGLSKGERGYYRMSYVVKAIKG